SRTPSRRPGCSSCSWATRWPPGRTSSSPARGSTAPASTCSAGHRARTSGSALPVVGRGWQCDRVTGHPPLDDRARARSAALAGLRDGTMVIVAYVPFGLALGVALASTRVDPITALLSSPIIFAGASQLVAVQLLDQGAGILLVVVSVAVVNARHLLYSASLQPHLADWPRGVRMFGAFFLADPVYALVIARYER